MLRLLLISLALYANPPITPHHSCALWIKYLNEIAFWEEKLVEAIRINDSEYTHELRARIRRIQQKMEREEYQ